MTELEKLQKAKKMLLKKLKPLVSKKEKMAKKANIDEPMSAEEKKLNKQIADMYSDVNTIVRKIRKLKKG